MTTTVTSSIRQRETRNQLAAVRNAGRYERLCIQPKTALKNRFDAA
jgi:hypothetical protein